MGSAIQGCYLLVSPLVGLVLNRVGYRWTALGGIVVCCMSYGACFLLSDKFWAFAFFYGVTNGFGMGLMNMAANSVIPLFFEKKQGLLDDIFFRNHILTLSSS